MEPLLVASTIATTVNNAMSIAKNLRDVDIKLNEANYKMQIAELTANLAEISIQAAALKNEILKKDEMNKELESRLKLKASVHWKDPVYFVKSEGDKMDGPYCQQCYDTKGMLVRLPSGDSRYWVCKSCHSTYENAEGWINTSDYVSRSMSWME